MNTLQEAELQLSEKERSEIGAGAEGALDRNRAIVRTSFVGIAANIALAAFKAAVGLLSHSIAIVMDAVNNLSDALSSIITIVGVKLAGREPDQKHPFGYGRIEYLSAMLIALIVLYAGVTSLTESVKAIIDPAEPEYSTPALIIVAVGVVAKVVLGRYVKAQGERYHSDSLVNSGEDATLDSIISASTLVAALIYLGTGLSLEAWLGAVISLVIVKSGIEMLSETISQLLGERAGAELAQDIKATVCSFPEVNGAYDLILNNYGPDTYNGSIHIEVPDTYTADQLDELIRAITYRVFCDHHVILSAIGIYSVNTQDEQVVQVREHVRELVMGVEGVLQMHGFFLSKERKTMRFDVVIRFGVDRRAAYRQVIETVQAAYPDYQVSCNMDTDFTES